MDFTLLIPAVISCLLALIVTPLVRMAALRWRIVDAPDGYRKLHGRTVPLGGGVAVAIAAGLTCFVAYLLDVAWAKQMVGQGAVFYGAAGAAALICLIGLIDDAVALRGRQKLIGQVAAAGVVVLGGTTISSISIFDCQFDLGLLSIPFTVFWLVGAVNAINLIDGVDGLASTVGIILSVTLAVLAAWMGHTSEAIIATLLASALVGFLFYNWAPAKIFLGDSGSMFIGLCLGILAIRGSFKGPATVALAAPAAIGAIPLFDVGMAILRRKLTGQSIYATDRGHIHHVLQRHGLSASGIVLSVGALCMLCGLGALASVFWKSEATAFVVVGAVFSMLIATRSFGHLEWLLLQRWGWGFINSFIGSPTVGSAPPLSTQVHGSRNFSNVWQSLVELGERFDLSSLQFGVNAPMVGEVFHATWQRRKGDSGVSDWRTEIPLTWNGHTIGRLKVSAAVPAGVSPFLWSVELLEALEPLEDQVGAILAGTPSREMSIPATVRVA